MNKNYFAALVVFLGMFWAHSAFAATCTFVADGTSRNWSSAGSWTGCSGPPTAADDVVFSSNAASSSLTIDGTSVSPSLCRSIDTTNYTRTILFANGKELDVGTSSSGAFKMTAGMTFVPGNTSLVKFVSTTTGNNITFGGYAFGNMTYAGVGGGWQWQDTNSMAANQVVTLTNGSLDTNSQALTNNLVFSSNNSNTRSLTLGTTNWKLILGSAATIWDVTNSTGMTLSAASSTITISGTSSNSTFAGGGLTYGTLTSTTLTTASLSITGANTFGTLTLSTAGTTKLILSGYQLYANQTVTGTFTAAGNSLILRNFIYSDTIGTPRTISAGTFAITNTDLRDITKAGAGSGNISATSSSTGNGDCGGNSGWTFQATRNVYKVSFVSTNWSASNWFTTSGGVTNAVPPLPLCQDTAIFDVNSITAGSKIVTVDQPRIPGFNWTGIANTPAFAIGSTEFEVYGSWITVAGMTNTGSARIDFMGRSSSNIISIGVNPPTVQMGLNCGGGTYTLATNLTNGGAAWFNSSGTLNFGGFTLTAAAAPTLTGGSWVGPGNYNAFVLPNPSAGGVLINPGMYGGFQ